MTAGLGVGLPLPALAYPPECTGNASDGTPRCVPVVISEPQYGLCSMDPSIDITLSECYNQIGGGVAITDQGTADAVLSCGLKKAATFAWQSEGAQYTGKGCWDLAVVDGLGVEIHGWALYSDTSVGLNVVARRDRNLSCPDGYASGNGQDPNVDPPDYCIKDPCTQCTQALIALSGPTTTYALIAGPALVETATVTQNGAPLAGANVTVSSGGGSGGATGVTDGNGQFSFTFVPPYVAATVPLTATCSTCSNTAQTTIQVLACDACQKKGNPVGPSTGEKFQTESDWMDQSPHGLSIIRNYRSFGLSSSAGMGGNWTHNFAGNWTQNGLQATVWLGDGTRVVFSRTDTNSAWVADNKRDSLSYVLSNGNVVGADYISASDETHWHFDSNGRPTSIVQRNGWTYTMAYSTAGQLQTVSNAIGRALQFGYSNGLLSSITLPTGQILSYGYDSNGRLVSAGFPDGSSRSYAYANPTFSQALTSITNEAGVVYAIFSYDSAGRAIGTQHVGGVQNYSFNYPTLNAQGTTGQLTTSSIDPSLYMLTAQVTDPLGNQQTYRWQGGDGQIHFLGASGTMDGETLSTQVFDPTTALPSSETDFLGNVTTYQWDSARRLLLSQTTGSGSLVARTRTTQWLANWRLPAVEAIPTKLTTYVYQGQPDPFNGGAIASCAPAAAVFADGSPVPLLCKRVEQATTDASGSAGVNAALDATVSATVWQWSYNTNAQILSQTDPRGQVSTFAYDSSGNLSTQTNALGQITNYSQYDGAGRLLTSTDANGVTTTLGYDARGHMTSRVVGAQSTTYTYGPTGLLISSTQSDGASQKFGYDSADRLVSVTDSLGNSIQYTLDGAGNHLTETAVDPTGTLHFQVNQIFNTLGQKQQVTGME